METNIYAPFTEEEYKELREKIDPIKEFLPEFLLNYIWGSYKKITKSQEPQPCSCGSAAKHWIKAVASIREFIKGIEEKKNGNIG